MPGSRAREFGCGVRVGVALCLFTSLFLSLCHLGNSWSYMKQASGFQSSGGYIRQAPFCVDEKQIDDKLYRFESIFDQHNENTFIPVSPDGKTSPSGMIKNFEVKAITVADRASNYSGTLKNWLHINIESHVPLQGLYVQAISAPWGVPFGEFVSHFDCGDCNQTTSIYNRFINIVPCIHRPALAFQHPNVFSVGAEKGRGTRTKFNEIHFHFKYTQYPCAEHTYAQFLVIAVRNFDTTVSRFETFFTSIYEMSVNDNEIGAYYPFYHGWKPDELFCHDTEVGNDFRLFSKVNLQLKLRYNTVFDECVLRKDGAQWYTCPPGPIQLKDPPTDLADWRTRFRDKYRDPTESNAATGDAQFCFDSGRWEWGLGKPTWPIPPDLIWDSESLPVESAVKGEDDRTDPCDNVTLTPDHAPECFEPNPYEGTPICKYKNIHTTECRPSKKPPNYGKDNGNRVPKDWNNITFSEQFDELAWRWGQKYILRLHGQLLIFAWTVCLNVMAYAARFMKENTEMQKKSSYFGIGTWIWNHIIWTYIHIAASFSGLFLVSFHVYSNIAMEVQNVHGLHDLCNIRNTPEETKNCVDSIGHKYCGTFITILFFAGYASGWGRPTSSGLRLSLIIYHLACGYIGKLLCYVTIFLVGSTLPINTIYFLIATELMALIMFLVASLVNCLSDRGLDIEISPKRRICPVPEGVDYFENASYKTCKYILFPLHIVLQIVFFILFLII